MFVREQLRDPIDEAGDPRRDLLGLPPVLHGATEAGRHRWPSRTVPEAIRPAADSGPLGSTPSVAGGEAEVSAQDHFYGGQPVIEGVMMRGRGHWAVSVRRPDQPGHVVSPEVRATQAAVPLFAQPRL